VPSENLKFDKGFNNLSKAIYGLKETVFDEIRPSVNKGKLGLTNKY